MKIHTGDTVLVISGKDKGKQGSVLRVLAEKNRLIIEGINMRVRHVKKTAQQAGQRIKYEASMSASNVMILDPKTKKPTRIGYKVDPVTGKKVRIAKVSGEVLPVQATTKAATAKKVTKATKETKGTKAATATEEKVSSPSSRPKKLPFWKRAFSGGPSSESSMENSTGADAAHPSAAPIRRSRESS